MRVAEIKLKNFFSHEQETIVLLDPEGRPIDGIFHLAGESRWGKSTLIVDAVTYALFGPVGTRISARDAKHEDMRNTAAPQDEVRVEVRFIFANNSTMRIVRGFRGPDGKIVSFAEAYEPDPQDPTREIRVTTSAQDTNRYVRTRLGGMSFANFANTFIARQRDIFGLLDAQAAVRRDSVHKALGIAEHELARKELSNRLSYCNARVKQLVERVSGRDDKTERSKVQSAQDALEQARQRAARAEQLQAQLLERRQQLEDELVPLQETQKLRARIEALTNDHDAAGQRVNELRARSERHAQAQAVVAEADKVLAKLRRAQDDYQRARDDYARSKAHADKQQELQTIGTRLEALAASDAPEISSAEISQQITQLEAEAQRLTQEHSERSEHLARLRDSGECYVCHRGFDHERDHQAVLGLVEQEVYRLRAEAQQAQAQADRLHKELPAVRAEEQTYEQRQRERIAVEAQVDQLTSQLTAIADGGEIKPLADLQEHGRQAKAQLDEAQAAAEALQVARGQLDDQAVSDFEHSLERQQQIAHELAQVRQQLSAKDEAADPQPLESELQEIAGRLAKAEGALPEITAAVTAAERQLQVAQDDYAAFTADYSAWEEQRQKIAELRATDTYLQRFADNLVSDIRPAIEELASEMLAQISDGHHIRLRLDEDYNISVQDHDGHWYKKALLSGGEEVRAAICLRLALACLVAQRTGVPIRFLVFDEPLPSQDPGHVARILELLSSLRNFFGQIFLISHVGDLRNADHVDYVLQFQAPPGRERVELLYA